MSALFSSQMLIVWLYLVVTLVIGLRSGKELSMSKLENWGAAGRTTGALVQYFLVAASGISAYTFLGSPGWAYLKGAPSFYVVTYLAIMGMMAYYFGPRAWGLGRKYNLMTLSQAFGDRYDSKFLRALSAVVGSIMDFAYGVLQATGCAYILTVLTGGYIQHWQAVVLVMLIMAIFIYTSGMRAVALVNLFQGVLMLVVSVASGLYMAKVLTGTWWFTAGLKEVVAAKPAAFTLPGMINDMPWQFWTTSILLSFLTVSNGGWIGSCAAKDESSVRRSRTWLPTYYLILLPTIYIGYMGILKMPGLKSVVQIAVQMGMKYFPPLLVGLYGAGTLAAAMSSAQPGMHTTALCYARDVLQPFTGWDDAKTTKVARSLVWVAMVIIMAIAIKPGTTLVYMLLWGYAFGSQLFPPTFGLLWWPRATKQGAIAGLVTGFAVALYFTTGAHAHPYHIHGGFIGLACNMFVMVAVSLLTKPSNRSTIEKYFPDIAANVLEDRDV